MDPVLSVVGLLAVVLLVLAAAYVFTRWAGKHWSGGLAGWGGSGQIEVLDRAGIGRDQTLLMVRAGQRYLLLGSTPAGVTLLAELTKEEGENWNPPASGGPEKKSTDFLALMQRLREKK